MQELVQLFYQTLKQNWNNENGEIIFPNQNTEPTASIWLRPRLMFANYYVSRKNCELGYGLFHIGVFSTKDNEYEIFNISEKLKEFLHKANLENSHYTIRCHEFQVQLLGSFKDTKLERIVHNMAITINFEFERTI